MGPAIRAGRLLGAFAPVAITADAAHAYRGIESARRREKAGIGQGAKISGKFPPITEASGGGLPENKGTEGAALF